MNAGDWGAATVLQQTIDRLMDIYAVGSPFIPFIKAATALRGVPVSSTVSFPFPAVTPDQTQALRRILARESLRTCYGPAGQKAQACLPSQGLIRRRLPSAPQLQGNAKDSCR